MKKTDARKIGFNQKKPLFPGIYFYLDPLKMLDAPKRIKEGRDVAQVYWKCENWCGENIPDGHWRLHTLGGVDMAWGKGLWLKGPIIPSLCVSEPPPKPLFE